MNRLVSSQEDQPNLSILDKDLQATVLDCKTCSVKKSVKELKWNINFYKTIIKRSQQREDALKKEQSDLIARIKYLEAQLYGKKSEKRCRNDRSFYFTKTKNNRGHRAGVAGPKRRIHSNLPIVEDIKELESSEMKCPDCNLPYTEINSTEDSKGNNS